MPSTPIFVSADPTLFNPQSGRLDASRIASEIQLPVSTIAEAIGKKAPSVRKHPDASSLQPELRRVYRIWVAIVGLYAGNTRLPSSSSNAANSSHSKLWSKPWLQGSQASEVSPHSDGSNDRYVDVAFRTCVMNSDSSEQ
jgi:hypothetical protein